MGAVDDELVLAVRFEQAHNDETVVHTHQIHIVLDDEDELDEIDEMRIEMLEWVVSV